MWTHTEISPVFSSPQLCSLFWQILQFFLAHILNPLCTTKPKSTQRNDRCLVVCLFCPAWFVPVSSPRSLPPGHRLLSLHRQAILEPSTRCPQTFMPVLVTWCPFAPTTCSHFPHQPCRYTYNTFPLVSCQIVLCVLHGAFLPLYLPFWPTAWTLDSFLFACSQTGSGLPSFVSLFGFLTPVGLFVSPAFGSNPCFFFFFLSHYRPTIFPPDFTWHICITFFLCLSCHSGQCL